MGGGGSRDTHEQREAPSQHRINQSPAGRSSFSSVVVRLGPVLAGPVLSAVSALRGYLSPLFVVCGGSVSNVCYSSGLDQPACGCVVSALAVYKAH